MTHRAFQRAQISNVEDTPGSAEAATEILLGTVRPKENLTIHWPNYDQNNLSLHTADDLVVGEEVGLVWESDLTPRQAVFAACSGIRGNVTPTQPDSTNQPNAYLWTVAPAYTTANDPSQSNGVDTFTVEYGNNTQAYETEYTFALKWTISGNANEVIKSTVEWVGRQRTDTTFTAALSKPTVQRLPFNLSKWYIDSSWANLGNTQATATIRSFTWEFETGLRPMYTADGNLYFSCVAETRKAPKLTLTYLHNSTSDAERTKFENRTTTFIRGDLLGATELDSGQSNVPYVQIDGAYRYEDWPEPGEDEGLVTFQVPLMGVYDSTGTAMMSVKILNLLSAYAS